MTVRYVIGRASQGKSFHILNEIKASLNRGGDDKLLLVVPDQFTLQAERDLIQKLQLPGIMRVEVLSFTRLAGRVLGETGGKSRVLINEQGRQMVLRRVIDEKARQMTIYNNALKQSGFVELCSDFIAELKQHDVSAADLRKWYDILPADSILRQKLTDMACIYEAFNDYLQSRYIDTDDYFNLFIEQAEQSALLRNCRMWIDSFTTFSPQTLKIINRLMGIVPEITIGITMDAAAISRDRDLFAPSRWSWQRISAMASDQGVREEYIHISDEEQWVPRQAEIRFLERELYAYPASSFSGQTKNLHLTVAANPYTEVENVAVQIINLAREQGYRWREIAVVNNAPDIYGHLIARVFSEYGIPFFMDQKKDIMNHPVVQLILYSLAIIHKGYRYEDVFAYLKTGFTNLKAPEYERLENYALQYGIKGKKWKELFRLGENNEEVEDLNRCRDKFVTPLEKLESDLQGAKSFQDITVAILAYLEQLQVEERLKAHIAIQTEQNQYNLVWENTQIWNIVMGVFQQMQEILGDQTGSLKEYRRVLEAGLLSYQLGIIPTTVDQILAGSVNRSISHDVRAMFVLGINDGVLPAGKLREGIISDAERQYLNEAGLQLGPDQQRRAAEERLLIYSIMSKPSSYLGISYALADEEGKALRPSLLVNRIKKLFPQLSVVSELETKFLASWQLIATPESSFKYLIENLRRHMDGHQADYCWWDAYAWYNSHEEWQTRMELLRQAWLYSNQADALGPLKARQLYGLPLRSSVSRLEKYINCPFAHFVNYGLRPAERKLYTVSNPDIGDIFHRSLLAFSEQLASSGTDWHCLGKTECEAITDRVMDQILEEHGHGIMDSSPRYRYLGQRLKRINRRAIWILTRQLQKGEFTPLGHELRFGSGGSLPPIGIELNDGGRFYVEGRIDRVDLWNTDEGTFIKVIDYKSGSRELNLYEVYYGLNLQLFIYLMALLQTRTGEKPVIPAGLFYFKIDDPMISCEESSIEAIEREVARKLKMKGLALAEVKVIQAMDRDCTDSSEVFPVRLKRNGEIYSNSPVLKLSEFDSFLTHIRGLLQQTAAEIMQGRVNISPVSIKGRTACRYCPYHSLCQFDRLFKDNQYKTLRPLSREEILQRLGEGTDGR